MSSTFLTFRPVRPEDKTRVVAFTRNTWGGEDDDYIKDVFDEWLIDPRGEFTAAVVDDRVVGIAKLTDMGNAEWWFEGLRIDPEYRLRGIATAFNRYHVDLAKQLGGRLLRYMTGGSNVGSQVIGAQAGFQHIITYTAYVAEAVKNFSLPTLLTLTDVPALLRWLASPLMNYLHGVYRNAWSAKTLTTSELTRIVEAQLAYGLKDEAGQIMAWALLRSDEYDDTEDGEPRRLRVDHFDGEMRAVTNLAEQMRSLATTRERSEVSAGICDYPPLVEALIEAGYHMNPDKFSLWILELKLTSEAEDDQ